MSRKLAILIVLTSLSLGFGCSDDENPVRTEQTPPYFANTIGSYWKYVAYDSVRDTLDTIVVQVTDTATIDSTRPPAAQWTYPSAHQFFGVIYDDVWIMLDTQFTKAGASDSLLVAWWQPDAYVWVKEVYLLPFSVGSAWAYDGTGAYLPESTFVVDSSTVVVPGGSFPGTFKITTPYNCGDECEGRRTMWYCPGVGVVKFARWEWDHFDFPDGKQLNASWELIDHHVALPTQ